MIEGDLLQSLARGEDSRQQFKRDATNADGMAAELAALANSGGGTVFWVWPMTAALPGWIQLPCGV